MAGVPDLPTDFDVIVIGTGLEESIVAAAVARNGHSILHIDTKDYYGGAWSAFTFTALQNWIKSENKLPEVDREKLKELLKDGEKLSWMCADDSVITNVKEQWFVPEDNEPIVDVVPVESEKKQEENEEDNSDTTPAPAEVSDQVNPANPDEAGDEDKQEKTAESKPASHHGRKLKSWTKTAILKERNFNLDLTPRLLYSIGSMVDLLIQSNISRYTEFKAVSRVMTVLNGELESVPSSRADVFATKHVSVVEKRILMKFIQTVISYQDHPEVYEAFESRRFLDFLKHQKLTDNLIHFVLHSIAMVDVDASCLEGLEATQKFLRSLGRFGNTPFLYSSFGSGELPQAFCRLCAVFGGTYYLGRSIEAVITDGDNAAIAIVSDGQRINCKKLVVGGSACPADLKSLSQDLKNVERKICLTNDSMVPSEKEQLTFLTVPPKEAGRSYTYVTEVGHGASVCPRGMYCIHMTKRSDGEDGDSLDNVLEQILPAQDKRLWSLDFEVVDKVFEAVAEVKNLHLCRGPTFELDYDVAIANASKIYKDMFPEEPFLPRAPDPEEIILGEPEEEANAAEGDSDSKTVEKPEKETSEQAEHSTAN